MESRFEQILKQKIKQEIDKTLDILSQSGAKDYSDYKEMCGFILGLRSIYTLLDEAHKDLTGE